MVAAMTMAVGGCEDGRDAVTVEIMMEALELNSDASDSGECQSSILQLLLPITEPDGRPERGAVAILGKCLVSSRAGVLRQRPDGRAAERPALL